MITLGIECTAHTLSIGIVRKTDRELNVLANVIDTYSGGEEGLIPRKLADHHSQVFASVLDKALQTAKIKIEDIDLVAFSQGPGIGAPLSVGISAAKYIALTNGKPLVGVNHCFAHVKISETMCGVSNKDNSQISPLILYLSGGNSQILVEDKKGYYHILGETLDIGIGNLFDSFARAIKMKNAHGSALAKLAEGGKYVELPYSVKGMNLVFSGLQTAAEKAAKTHSHKDVAYSLMETSFAMVVEATERALFLSGKTNLVVCGGVAQNRRLQEMLRKMCHEAEVGFGVAPDEFNRDNGAMIAYAGMLLYERYGPMQIKDCNPITNYRIDKMKEIVG